jgi:hypothetical protein
VGELPPENDNLMLQGDKLTLQRCATANTEREQGNESGQDGGGSYFDEGQLI